MPFIETSIRDEQSETTPYVPTASDAAMPGRDAESWLGELPPLAGLKALLGMRTPAVITTGSPAWGAIVSGTPTPKQRRSCSERLG